MSIDKDPPKMTPAAVKLADEATIFVLAGCMLTVYRLMQSHQTVAVAQVFKKVGIILAREPDFIKRFEQAQKEVMEEFNKMAGPKIVVPS